MQRILNDPDNIVDEMLSGFLKANSDIVEATENKRVVKARCKGEGQVGVITGGGSGHKPAFIGYVGENMCDAAGNVFASQKARHIRPFYCARARTDTNRADLGPDSFCQLCNLFV